MANKGVNTVILVGHLGNDPQLNKTGGNRSVCNLSVATSESWNDQNGTRQELVEWHRVVIWGKSADIAAQYLSKGDPIYIRGKNRTRPYTDDQGVNRSITEVVVDQHGEMQMIGSKNKPSQSI